MDTRHFIFLLGGLLSGIFDVGYASDFHDDLLLDEQDINEGELAFLQAAPATPVHHHQHRINITPSSLAEGWVVVSQCHHNLDPVPLAQITFREGRLRNLKILSTQNIGKAWVEGASVQLEDVEREASLCLKAGLKTFTDLGDGKYRLRSGPFMRRFLDGFYPMQLSYEVDYSGSDLLLERFSPSAQPGFSPEQKGRLFVFDSWFEGELHLELIFRVDHR